MPVARWVTPEVFDELKRTGETMGIGHVEASPLTRSSYHAKQAASAAIATPLAGTSVGGLSFA
jgi:lipoic acid synthetase